MSDHISLVGNVVGELERRTTRDGGPVASFRLAVGERRLDRERNEWVDGHTSFYAISAFGELGANALLSLRKGERVVVTGRLRLREWENETTRGVSADVVADSVGHDLRWGTTRFVRTPRPDTADKGGSDDGPARGAEQTDTERAAVDGWAVPGAETETPAGADRVRDAVAVGGGAPPVEGPF